MYPAKVGDFVIVNLSNEKIKEDVICPNVWTPSYRAFLDGRLFKITDDCHQDEDGSTLFTLTSAQYGEFLCLREEFLLHYDEEEEGASPDVKSEQVHSPKHYNVLEDIEAIQIIASSMTYEMFKGYCLGNILKYRLRCGAKDDVTQELAKADKYKELFAKYNHMCKGEK